MAGRVFFSFHFANDFWRTQQVRNINALEGKKLCSSNDWEEGRRKGNESIKKWIDDQMHDKSRVVVLVGAETANRPWILHEYREAGTINWQSWVFASTSYWISTAGHPLLGRTHFLRSLLRAPHARLPMWGY